MKCTVKLVWDNEADIWYTESEDIPGLVHIYFEAE